MQGIINFLQAAFHWIFALAAAMIQSLFNLLSDLVCWVLEQFLDLIIYLLSLLPLQTITDTNIQHAIATLPAQLLNILWLIGAPQALAIVMTAYLVRLFLQFIPFTRLGS